MRVFASLRLMADLQATIEDLWERRADLSATDSSLPGMPDRGGVAVHGVTTNGPAAEAGVLEGDVIVAIDGTRVRSMGALQSALHTYEPGQQATLHLQRGGEDMTVEVTLAEREDD